MNHERFKKVEEIYHAALNIAPAERGLFLKKACGKDAAMLEEVEALLAYEDVFDRFIDTPPESIAAEMFAETADAKRQNSDIIGKRINQYKILSILGEGGMGTVYLAEDTKLERKVAVKLLTGDFADDATRLNRFFQEAKSASALNHPNILTVHEMGEFDATHFIVTEFIKGKTLNKFLNEENSSISAKLEIAAQIASALTAAHEAGIVHRDLKPDNLMVRSDGIVKILDFGIAKLTDLNNSTEIDAEAKTVVKYTITMPGMIIGTPQYMSPEQARGQKIDFRSDIFSFGVVLYEMLTGKPPFAGATNMDVIGSILKDEPTPLGEHLPEVSHDLERIVHKALRKDREQRYQHIKDLLIDLSDVKKTLEFETGQIYRRTHSERAHRTTEETSSLARQPRFSFLHVLFFLLILSAAIGGIYWWLAAHNEAVLKTADLKTAEVANWSSSPGETYSVGSFSPDAKMVAFTSTRGGSKNIWVKQTVSGESIQVTKDDFGNRNPVWSPAGDELAFFSTRGKQAGIWRIPPLGGSPVFVAEIKDLGSQLKFWSKGNLIYYESKNDLYAVDINSGAITQVAELSAKNAKPTTISLARDEGRIAFASQDEKTWNLWTADAKGENAQKFFSGQNPIKNVVWHPDGKRILFSSRVDETYQIFVADTNGAPPQQITFAETDVLALDVSSDGTRILYGSAKEESDIWGVNLKDSKEFTVAVGIDSEFWVDVSPDGKTIAYQSIKNLSQGNKMFNGNIMTKNLAEKDNQSLLVSNAFLPKWSPDGKTLAFMRLSGDKFQIETINAGGGGQNPVTREGISAISNSILPYNRTQTSDYSWSPDGQKIAYLSDRNDKSNVWIINSDGSNDTQLTTNDANLSYACPLWSADGKRISLTSQTRNVTGKPTFNVSIIDAETKKADPIWSGNTFIKLVGWSASEKELILASVESGVMTGQTRQVSLLLLTIETKQLSEIVKLNETYLYNIHLSPDKKTVAFVAHRNGLDNIWTIPATSGAAKQVTGNNDTRFYFSSLAWSPDGSSIFYGKQSRFSLLSMLTNFK